MITRWQISLTREEWRTLWRLVPGTRPMPTALRDLTDDGQLIPLAQQHQRVHVVRRALQGKGCLRNVPGHACPAPPVDYLLPTLAGPDVAVEVRMKVDGRRTHASYASGRTGLAAAVLAGGVRLELNEATSPARAAVSLLPPAQHGNLRFNVPSAHLLYAAGEWENAGPRDGEDAFVRALKHEIGDADAQELFELVRGHAAVRATFAVTVRRGRDSWSRADSVVEVRDSPSGRYIVRRQGEHTTFQGATQDQLVGAVDSLVASVGSASAG